MKTLYIPTTTLNFNNIMSCESISPKAFYAKREFGYKTWHCTNENPFDNSLLLYEEIPVVYREVSDYDDYPLIIAITISEEMFEDMLFTNIAGVWQYDKTIYLNPSYTTLFFDSEEHKRIAWSKSESSAETKMVALYQSKMFCAQMTKQYDVSSCKDVDLCQEAINKDRRINSMKGFLYGYYIGAAMSMNDKDVIKLNILNEIKNILAAILASLNNIATEEQVIRLQKSFDQLKQFDPIRIELSKLLESNSIPTEEKIDRIITLMNSSNCQYSLSGNLPYLLNEIKKGKPEYGENPAILWINKVIDNHIQESKTHKVLLRPGIEEICISSLSLSSINSINIKEGKPQELFVSIVNDVIPSTKYNGKISTFKMELATEITLKARDVFGEEWNESCTAKTYLNALRKHIGGESFNQKWNSGILSSIAAVILKGDDWEKLLEFLQTKGIADYRLAFAIYGELNGFANMTRDFSDIILKENEEYVKAVYQNFHHQIHGAEACIADVPEYITPIVNTKLRTDVKDVFNTLTSKQKRVNASRIEQALELEAAQGDFNAYLYILNNLINTRTTIYKEIERVLHLPESQNETLVNVVNNVLRKFTKKNDAQYCQKARFALELENKIGDPISFCYMLDDLNVPKNVRDKFFTHFGIKQGESTINSIGKKDVKELDLFGSTDEDNKSLSNNNLSLNIIYDPNAYNYIANFSGLGRYKNIIVSLFQEFQKKYQSGYYFQNPQKYKRNNNDVVDHFCIWCTSKKNPNALLGSQETANMIDELKNYLLKKYHD